VSAISREPVRWDKPLTPSAGPKQRAPVEGKKVHGLPASEWTIAPPQLPLACDPGRRACEGVKAPCQSCHPSRAEYITLPDMPSTTQRAHHAFVPRNSTGWRRRVLLASECRSQASPTACRLRVLRGAPLTRSVNGRPRGETSTDRLLLDCLRRQVSVHAPRSTIGIVAAP